MADPTNGLEVRAFKVAEYFDLKLSRERFKRHRCLTHRKSTIGPYVYVAWSKSSRQPELLFAQCGEALMALALLGGFVSEGE